MTKLQNFENAKLSNAENIQGQLFGLLSYKKHLLFGGLFGGYNYGGGCGYNSCGSNYGYNSYNSCGSSYSYNSCGSSYRYNGCGF